MEQHPNHKISKKNPDFLNLLFRFILGLLGSVFISILILKILGNFYILLVIAPIADFFLWKNLQKNKATPEGKWVLYGAMTGFTLLLIGLLIVIIGLNVVLQGIIQ
ncbi:hypothetical protein IT413_05100 [Candidatus Peregrinibacteria bacterium]|nr:hypothetical protein [Candidatus Peregrinibacteria bacterium]